MSGVRTSSSGAELDRSAIAQDLDSILHRDPTAQANFIKRSLNAISVHRLLVEPSIDNGIFSSAKLGRLMKSGHAFARDVSALGDDEKDLLEQGQWHVLAKRRFPEFSETAQAGEWARVTAQAANWLLRQGKRCGGRPPGRSELLVNLIAAAYAECFGERPSAAREGHFFRALCVLLDEARIPRIGQTQLTRILNSASMTADRPKRGPKPRLENSTKPCRRS